MGHANMNAIREVTAQATRLHAELTYGVFSGRQQLEPGLRAERCIMGQTSAQRSMLCAGLVRTQLGSST